MKRNHRLEFLRRNALDRGISRGRKSGEPIELIVKAESGKRDWLAAELGKVGKVTHVFSAIPYLSVSCDSSDAYNLAQVFRKLADSRAYRAIASAVSVIDVSSKFSIPAVSRKTRASVCGGLWNLESIGAYDAQGIALGDGVKMAIVDTGVDYGHSELRSNFGDAKGYDFVRNKSDPMDFNGHGTHVAGIAVGRDYGIARACRVYAVRVLDENGIGSEANTIAGLDWADRHGADVVNMSLGSPTASTALEDMCYYLANRGVLVVAAAGNSGYGPNYPAAFGEPVIAVAAVDENGKHADFSNIYETNDISAPGVDITSAYLGGYATLSGTSMASPHVAGSLSLVLSALMRERNLEELMEETAQKLDSGAFPERDVYGAGLVRVDRMARAAAESGRKLNAAGYGREILAALKEVLWE